MKGCWLMLAMALATPWDAAAASPTPCPGPAEFMGQIIIGSLVPGTVGLTWTVAEDASVRGYRLYRYEVGCSHPRRCATRVAAMTVRPDPAAPVVLQTHELLDTAPPGKWIYQLEIRRRHGASCWLETDPIVVATPPSCTLVDVCSQVEASFVGTVVSTGVVGVEWQWLTHAESEAIAGYRLSRYDCARRGRCSTEIVTIDAAGSCGEMQLHGVTDRPPPGRWTYALEVLGTRGGIACLVERTVRVTP